jgi:hypothetical protein
MAESRTTDDGSRTTDLDDPQRADAGLVWRALRGGPPGGLEAAALADLCFPVRGDLPDAAVVALRRRSVGRVLEAVVWMRSRGVRVTCVSIDGASSRFVLGEY